MSVALGQQIMHKRQDMIGGLGDRNTQTCRTRTNCSFLDNLTEGYRRGELFDLLFDSLERDMMMIIVRKAILANSKEK
jgi:hypothetical protein